MYHITLHTLNFHVLCQQYLNKAGGNKQVNRTHGLVFKKKKNKNLSLIRDEQSTFLYNLSQNKLFKSLQKKKDWVQMYDIIKLKHLYKIKYGQEV